MSDITQLADRVAQLEAELAEARAHTRSVEAWAEGVQLALYALVLPVLKALPDVAVQAMTSWETAERRYCRRLSGEQEEGSIEQDEPPALLARVSRRAGVPSPSGVSETPDQALARSSREPEQWRLRGKGNLSP